MKMDAAGIEELKQFVDDYESDPSILNHPSLSFFRDFVERLGDKIPSPSHKHKESESMGDSSVEVYDENRDASQEAKAKGMEAISEGKLEEAIEHLTEAILLNPTSAIMYATRATVYIKMKKPNAAIRDADAALRINPDSAKGYKSRGIARSMLGQWEEAAKDLHVASKLDYDEEISSVLKKMGDSSVEVYDENRDASQEAKAKGMEAISEGKLEEAIEHLTEAILLNPTSAIMYATRATVYIKMKKPNAAIRDADAALRINPDSAKGYKSRGIARSMLGQWEEAAKDLHVASKLDYDEEISSVLKKMGDSSVEVYDENRDASQEAKAKGMEAISEGKLEEAIEHLTEAILLNPTSAIMYATRATVYIKMKKPNAAIRDADAALRINPDSAKGYKSRGIARSMLGQWEEAAKDLHVASKLDYDEEISSVLKKMGDSSVEVYDEKRDASQEAKAKGMEAISEGKLEEAIEHLTEAILLNPTSAIMYATRATVYIKMKKPNAAIRDADAALRINPDSAKGYKSRGIARSMLGQWEEAAKDLHVASKLDYDEEISSVLKKMGDSSVEVYDEKRDASQEAKAKGMEAISEGKLEEAIEHLTKAILLNPTSAIMYATRATVYIKMKKPNAAIRDADAALRINPDSAKGYKSRGIARSMLGQWEEAAKDLHVASKLDYDEEISSVLKKMGDSSVEVYDENRDASQEAKAKGMEAISEGKLEEAIEHLTEAILLNPTSAIMYATRATVYIKMKKPNAAIRDADAALRINPDSAKGYKSRGIARSMLGQWEEAAKDLHVASKLDYDEEISSVLKKMGDSSVEVSDESRDASQEAKAKGMEAISEGKLEEAIEHLTEAILLNPTSAIMYATRATVYIKMKKPNAAIRDADAALRINPDSAKGYKSRGIARSMLGQWEEAAKDLHVASKLDYDEEISSVLKKVEPNAHKIEEHRRKYDKLRKEREERKSECERQRRRAEAKAEYEKAKKQEQASSSERPGGFPGGMPGGFPGDMPGWFMPGGFPGGGMQGGLFPGGF